MASQAKAHVKKQTGNSVRRSVDALAYFVGVFGNIAVIPQIIIAWQSDAPGLAILTWVIFIFIGFIWLAYGILHHAKPLIVAQTVGILCNVLVVGGWIFNHWMN